MALAINERFLLGKSKEWVGYSTYLMIALVKNNNWEEIVGRYHAHRGTEFSISSCIPSKYMNQGKLSDPPFTRNHSPTDQTTSPLLSTWDPTGLDHGLQRKYLFCWIFNGFFCWKSEHTPWLSHMLANVLFSRLQKDTSRS